MIASVRGPCRAGEHRTATSEPQLMPYTEIVMIGPNDGLETDSNGCAFKPAPDGLAATEEIHGHGGRTSVRFLDEVDDRERPDIEAQVAFHGDFD